MSYTFLTPAQRDAIANGVYKYYANKGKDLKRQNDDMRPLLEKVFRPIMTSKHTFTDGEIRINTAEKSSAEAQSPYGLDELEYTEEHQGDTLVFNEGREWLGLLVIEDELRGLGYKVAPLGSGMSGISMSKAKQLSIVKELNEKIRARRERYLELLDIALHSDGTGVPDITGIRGLFPITNTAGTIGGISRSNPVYQHQVVTGLSAGTFGAPGDFRTLLDPVIRQANRFAKTGKLSIAVAGSTFMDTIKTFSENRTQWNGEASGVTKLDPSISDDVVYYQGVKIHWDPTLDNLADSEGDETLRKSCYMFNTSVMEFAHEEDMDIVRPGDEITQMVRREGLFGRYSVLVHQPNAACLLAQVD